jgi:hypothetical protein
MLLKMKKDKMGEKGKAYKIETGKAEKGKVSLHFSCSRKWTGPPA